MTFPAITLPVDVHPYLLLPLRSEMQARAELGHARARSEAVASGKVVILFGERDRLLRKLGKMKP